MRFSFRPLCWVLFLFFLFSSMSYAQSAPSPSVSCGMEVTGDGTRVKPGDFTICENDLAFQALFIMSAQVFESGIFRNLALLFVDESVLDSEFTKFASTTIGVSVPLFALMAAVASFAWFGLTFVLAFKSYKLFSVLRSFNSQEQRNRGDALSLGTYVSFLLVMIYPVNGIMFGQGLAIVGALPFFQISNAAYSTFLSETQTASADVNLNTSNILLSSQTTANELIEGQLCQQRTRQALLNENAKAGSSFFRDGITGWIWEEDQDDVIERYSTCLSYSGKGDEGPVSGSLQSYVVSKMTGFEFYCPRNRFFGDEVYYKPELYGYNHTCSQVRYDMGSSKFSALFDGKSESGEDMDDELAAIQSQFKTAEYYPKFKAFVANRVSQIVTDQNMSEDQKIASLNSIFADAADKVLGPALDGSRNLSVGNNDEKQLKFLAAQTALLGSTVDKTAIDIAFERGFMDQAEISFVNRYFGTEEEKRYVFGLDYFLDDARQVARLMQRYQCALNWHTNSDTRLFIVNFNSADSEDLEKLFGQKLGRLECVEFLPKSERGSTDFNRYARYPVLSDSTYSDLSNQDGIWKVSQAGNESSIVQTRQKMVGTIAQGYFRDMRKTQLTMAGYIMSVKLAIGSRLSKKLSEELEERQQDEDLRSRGFAVMAGTMLYLTKHQNSASHMGASIDDAFRVDGAGSTNLFVELAAFAPHDAELASSNISEKFSEVPVASLFTPGLSGVRDYPGPQGIPDEQEESDALSIFIAAIENMFFSPIEHIKNASGMSSEKSLGEGLQACYELGYSNCLSGQKHPMAALSNMGSDLMSNMLQLMMIDAAVKAINGTFYDNDDQKGSIEGKEGTAANTKGGYWSRFKTKTKEIFSKVAQSVAMLGGGIFVALFKLLGAISMVAGAIFDLIRPLIIGLFVVGAVFAYIIPVTAFLYGLMMFLFSVSGFLVIAYALPFYILYQFWKIEEVYNEGLKEWVQRYGGAYIKLPFIVIAIAVSFAMMSVSLYAMNTVFAVLLTGLTPDGSAKSATGLLTATLMNVMLYIIYFGALFVMMRVCLSFIKTMPGEIVQKMGFDQTNDEKYVDSLGFESYVSANMMRMVGSLPQNALDKLVSLKRNGGFKDKNTLEKQVKDMEAIQAQIERAGGPDAFASYLKAAAAQGAKKATMNSAARDPSA